MWAISVITHGNRVDGILHYTPAVARYLTVSGVRGEKLQFKGDLFLLSGLLLGICDTFDMYISKYVGLRNGKAPIGKISLLIVSPAELGNCIESLSYPLSPSHSPPTCIKYTYLEHPENVCSKYMEGLFFQWDMAGQISGSFPLFCESASCPLSFFHHVQNK